MERARRKALGNVIINRTKRKYTNRKHLLGRVRVHDSPHHGEEDSDGLRAMNGNTTTSQRSNGHSRTTGYSKQTTPDGVQFQLMVND